jgi:low temperature requirement protein LtrA
MLMAVAVPEAFGARGPLFAGAYVAVAVGRPLLLMLALRGNKEQQRIPARIVCWSAVSAVPWLTYSADKLHADRSAAFIVAFATTVLLWRLYFFRAGHLLTRAVAESARPAKLGFSAIYTHLVMVAGIIAAAVGYELVINHPFGRTDLVWLAVILGGPALFLAGRTRFEYEVFGRVSRSRLIGLLLLAALAPVMVFVAPLAVAMTATLVLAGMAIADAARARGRQLEAPTPPL